MRGGRCHGPSLEWPVPSSEIPPVLIVTPVDHLALPSAASTLMRWVRSTDGQYPAEDGESAISLLPRDEELVLALPPRALSWHRLTLPRVSGPRLRAALDGMLEDQVLTDVGGLHHALEPGGRAGQTVWVASTERDRLRDWLRALESAGRPVARIAPLMWPLVPARVPGAAGATRSFAMDSPGQLHWAHIDGEQVWLASASLLGVSCVPLREDQPLPLEALLPGVNGNGHDLRATDALDVWLADPLVAELAERALQRPFDPVPPAQWLLRAGQTDWNLAQFDLSLSSGARRGQRWRRAWRQFRSGPQWRAARWGLAALVAAQLVGLNLVAWQERQGLQEKQAAVRDTLTKTFPQVNLVLDAPAQMQREVARLQQASGQLAAGDLESLLAAVDRAAGSNPLSPARIGYDNGALRLSGWRANEDQVRALQQALQAGGWRAQYDGNELVLQAPQP
jgi:general secretion pathway protein L